MAVLVAVVAVVGVAGTIVIDRFSGSDVHSVTGVAATIPVGDSPDWIAVAPDGTVYVSNFFSATVSVISNDQVTATIQLREEHAGNLVVATDGTLYAVGTNGLGSDEDPEYVIHVVRDGQDVATIRADCGVFLAAGPDGKIYCSAEDSIVVIEGDKVVDTFSGVLGPRAIAVAPDGALYSSNGGDIAKIVDGKVVVSIPATNYVSRMTVGADGTLYVTSGDPTEVLVIRNDAVVAKIPITPPDPSVLISPHGVAVGPDGTVYVGSEGLGENIPTQVSVIQNDQVVRTILAGVGEATSLAVTPDGAVYVPNNDDNTVSVLR